MAINIKVLSEEKSTLNLDELTPGESYKITSTGVIAHHFKNAYGICVGSTQTGSYPKHFVVLTGDHLDTQSRKNILLTEADECTFIPVECEITFKE